MRRSPSGRPSSPSRMPWRDGPVRPGPMCRVPFSGRGARLNGICHSCKNSSYLVSGCFPNTGVRPKPNPGVWGWMWGDSPCFPTVGYDRILEIPAYAGL